MSNTYGHYNWLVLATLRDIHNILRGMCESQRLIAIGPRGKTIGKCQVVPSVIDATFSFSICLLLIFIYFFLTCSVFLLDVVSKYYSCTRRGEPGGRQLGHEVNRLDMAGIAKPFAILALRHLLIYHYYLSIVGLSIDSLSHIPMYISSKLSWHVASFLEFPLASERERVFS